MGRSPASGRSSRSARPEPPLRGFLNIDKPAGMTSFDVVRAVRRATGVRRVGHAGTLDPIATGVLPVAVGEATKLIDELVGARKRYRGVIALGVETDSDDAAGAEVARRDPRGVTPEALAAALEGFRGEFMQTPPAFSAVKLAGVPAYRAARRGEPHALEPRRVVVHALQVIAVALPQVTLVVECDKGFYMRALARDLGRWLGCGAHLAALRRTAVGSFAIESAVPLDEAVERLARGGSEGLLQALDVVLSAWPALILSRASVGDARQGREFEPAPAQIRRAGRAGERARGYGPDGQLVALFEATAIPGAWHPYRVLAPPPSASVSEAQS
ncbi:MAG: tRNA pseudouridine(55) synthase TruB [Dehalococcoidia bacterium]|nr:tRNA pseudouridine(55) synthase TruB [Dehalococcoidia bacterium]